MASKTETTEKPIDVIKRGGSPLMMEKSGFLPIETNWFDRFFIAVVIWVAMSLLWFRFIEPMGLSIWISNVIALALAVFIITKG